MELILTSIRFDDVATEGILRPEGSSLYWYTLELPFTDGLPGSAIPIGRFPVVLAPSPKFLSSVDPWIQQYAHLMPHIVDIPNRSLIMFHWGNTVRDVDGCVALGRTQGVDFVGGSRAAFDQFYPVIKDEAAAKNCFVTVSRR